MRSVPHLIRLLKPCFTLCLPGPSFRPRFRRKTNIGGYVFSREKQFLVMVKVKEENSRFSIPLEFQGVPRSLQCKSVYAAGLFRFYCHPSVSLVKQVVLQRKHAFQPCCIKIRFAADFICQQARGIGSCAPTNVISYRI